MLRSMTTFAKKEASGPDWSLQLELKSVNSRYFDLHVRAPREFAPVEDRIRRFLRERLTRGRVDLFIQYESFEDTPVSFEPKVGLVKGYLEAVERLAASVDMDPELRMPELLGLLRDAVISREEQADAELLWNRVEPVLEELVNAAMEMAQKEGRATEEDILKRIRRIEELAGKIQARHRESIEQQQQRLRDRILSRLKDLPLDEQRLIQETALLAERLDINEELVRLESHISQFYKYLEFDSQIGRKLDFLLQEIFREVNTIASKSSDSTIAHLVVEIKSEIEKIREQLQNIV